MKQIPLSRGYVALVDDEDFASLSRFKWFAQVAKHGVYAKRRGGPGETRNVYMHRQIMKSKRGETVDHINGNGLDNRRVNLRACSQAENTRNTKKRACSSSELKGVTWNKRRSKWHAKITFNYKSIHLGYYDGEIEAAKVYDKVARELFGEYARLNFSS